VTLIPKREVQPVLEYRFAAEFGRAGHEGLLNYIKVFTFPTFGRFCSFHFALLFYTRN
jgi:hypothetical protein